MSRHDMQQLARRIDEAVRGLGTIRLMEICGTHTVSLFRSGVKSLLPPSLRMVSGPGCPVCVTSQGYIDAACAVAARPDVTICTYGDMLRVPGRTGSLETRRSEGAEIVVVYSARDAVRFAREHRDRRVIFLAVGFETTAPATAAAVIEARNANLDNFFILTGHKLVIPAMDALLSAGDVPIAGFMLPGHVSVIIGVEAYRPIVDTYRKPCVVVGFEPQQMLRGILRLVEHVAAGEATLENAYGVAVTEAGNPAAQRMLAEVFEPADTVWRAIGTIPASGLELREPYRPFDAAVQFDLDTTADYDLPGCRCGEVIQGKLQPDACTLFGNQCTPTHPVGPCMVSSEGTCAAWFKYARTGTGIAAASAAQTPR